MSIKFDFHCHSDYSDGALEPERLIDYALDREITHLALTDHDSVSGLAEAHKYITENALPIRLINGLEISALTEYGEVHIVGLGIDYQCERLNQALKIQQEKRWERASLIDEKLCKAGISGVLDKCQQDVKQVITRSHIAGVMVKLGYVSDRQQAFKKYIGKQGRIKISKDWVVLDKAISLIHQAGGVAVLAHPTRYPLSNRKLAFLIQDFAQSGGDALELSYPSLNADKISWLKIQLENNQLLASSGSDFHYPDLKWTDLGRFPHIDSNIPHVVEKLIQA